MERRAIFEAALLWHHVDRLNWWRKRGDLPRQEPRRGDQVLQLFGAELGACLHRAQGRGRHCTVEYHARCGTHYYFAYPDDYVQQVQAHDEHGRLTPQLFRRTFLLVFAFTPSLGRLELCARVPAKLKPELELLFARVCLGHTLLEWGGPVYELDGLAATEFVLPTDPADGVEVQVREIRLVPKNDARHPLVLQADPAKGPDDLYRTFQRYVNQEQLPPGSYHITKATLTFKFHAVGDRRAGSMTFDICWPNSCNVRNQPPSRLELAQKYLVRWGILRDDSAGLAAA